MRTPLSSDGGKSARLGVKSQAPNPKLQPLPTPKSQRQPSTPKSQREPPTANSQRQLPITTLKKRKPAEELEFGVWGFRFGIWDLGVVGIWDLELGIWPSSIFR